MRVAKAKGHLRGKQPKLNSRQEAHLVELLRSGEYTTAELVDMFSVARSTVYRAVERSKRLTSGAERAGPAEGSSRRATPECRGLALAGERIDGGETAVYRPRHGTPGVLPTRISRKIKPARPVTASQPAR